MKRIITGVTTLILGLLVITSFTRLAPKYPIPDSVKERLRFGGGHRLPAPLICRDGAIDKRYLVNMKPGYSLDETINIHGWHFPVKPLRDDWYEVTIYESSGVDAIRADPYVRAVQCLSELNYDGTPLLSPESLEITASKDELRRQKEIAVPQG